jgi:hypothetical protein
MSDDDEFDSEKTQIFLRGGDEPKPTAPAPDEGAQHVEQKPGAAGAAGKPESAEVDIDITAGAGLGSGAAAKSEATVTTTQTKTPRIKRPAPPPRSSSTGLVWFVVAAAVLACVGYLILR